MHAGVLTLQYKVARLIDVSRKTYYDETVDRDCKVSEISEILEPFVEWPNGKDIRCNSYTDLVECRRQIFVPKPLPRDAGKLFGADGWVIPHNDTGFIVPILEKLIAKDPAHSGELQRAIQHCCEKWVQLTDEIAQMQKLYDVLDGRSEDLFSNILRALRPTVEYRTPGVMVPSAISERTVSIYSAMAGLSSMRLGPGSDDLSEDAKTNFSSRIGEIHRLWRAERAGLVLSAMQTCEDDWPVVTSAISSPLRVVTARTDSPPPPPETFRFDLDPYSPTGSTSSRSSEYYAPR